MNNKEDLLPDKGDKLLSVADAAGLSSLSEASIRLAIKDGRLKSIRLGPKLIRISESELIKFWNK